MVGVAADGGMVEGVPATVCRIVMDCFVGTCFEASNGVGVGDVGIVGEESGFGDLATVCHGEEGGLETGFKGKEPACGLWVACSFISCCCRLRSFWETLTAAFDAGEEAVCIAWVKFDTRDAEACSMIFFKSSFRALWLGICHGALRDSNPLIGVVGVAGGIELAWVPLGELAKFTRGVPIEGSDPTSEDRDVDNCGTLSRDTEDLVKETCLCPFIGPGKRAWLSSSISNGRSSAASLAMIAGLALGVLSGEASTGVGSWLLLNGDDACRSRLPNLVFTDEA